MDGQIFGRLGRLCMRAITDHAFLKKHLKLDMATRKALHRFFIFLLHAEMRNLDVYHCSQAPPGLFLQMLVGVRNGSAGLGAYWLAPLVIFFSQFAFQIVI